MLRMLLYMKHWKAHLLLQMLLSAPLWPLLKWAPASLASSPQEDRQLSMQGGAMLRTLPAKPLVQESLAAFTGASAAGSPSDTVSFMV